MSGANPLLENVEGGFAQHVLWFEGLVRVFVGALEEPVENVAALCSETRRVWPGMGWYDGGDVGGGVGRDIGSLLSAEV